MICHLPDQIHKNVMCNISWSCFPLLLITPICTLHQTSIQTYTSNSLIKTPINMVQQIWLKYSSTTIRTRLPRVLDVTWICVNKKMWQQWTSEQQLLPIGGVEVVDLLGVFRPLGTLPLLHYHGLIGVGFWAHHRDVYARVFSCRQCWASKCRGL
jgi:hypothetical protein